MPATLPSDLVRIVQQLRVRLRGWVEEDNACEEIPDLLAAEELVMRAAVSDPGDEVSPGPGNYRGRPRRRWQPEARPKTVPMGPQDLSWGLDEYNDVREYLVRVVDLIHLGLLKPEHALGLLKAQIQDPVIGPWHHLSPVRGAEWLKHIDNLREIERVVEIGFEMHEHEMVDFHGWGYGGFDDSFRLLLIRDLLSLDQAFEQDYQQEINDQGNGLGWGRSTEIETGDPPPDENPSNTENESDDWDDLIGGRSYGSSSNGYWGESFEYNRGDGEGVKTKKKKKKEPEDAPDEDGSDPDAGKESDTEATEIYGGCIPRPRLSIGELDHSVLDHLSSVLSQAGVQASYMAPQALTFLRQFIRNG